MKFQHLLQSHYAYQQYDSKRLGHQVRFELSEEEGGIALIEVSPLSPDWRNFLYQYGMITEEKTRIYDLGNLIHEDHEYLEYVLRAVMSKKLFPVLLGASFDHFNVLSQLFKARRRAIISTNDHQALHKSSKPITYTLLGGQLHKFSSSEAEILYLGDLKRDIELAAPDIRDSHSLYMDLNSLSFSAAPELRDADPSGWNSQQWAQLGRYAGFADELKCLAISNGVFSSSQCPVSSQTLAQTLWYFLEGRIHMYATHDNLEEYEEFLVELPMLDHSLHFRYSRKTDKWWMRWSALKLNKFSPWRSCTNDDYKTAKQGIIPLRLLKTIQ